MKNVESAHHNFLRPIEMLLNCLIKLLIFSLVSQKTKKCSKFLQLRTGTSECLALLLEKWGLIFYQNSCRLFFSWSTNQLIKSAPLLSELTGWYWATWRDITKHWKKEHRKFLFISNSFIAMELINWLVSRPVNQHTCKAVLINLVY